MKEAISPARVDDIAELTADAADWIRARVGEILDDGHSREVAADGMRIAEALEACPNLIARTETAEARAQAAEQRERDLEEGLRKVRDIAAEGTAKPSDVEHLRKTIMAVSSTATVALLSPTAPERSQGEG